MLLCGLFAGRCLAALDEFVQRRRARDSRTVQFGAKSLYASSQVWQQAKAALRFLPAELAVLVSDYCQEFVLEPQSELKVRNVYFYHTSATGMLLIQWGPLLETYNPWTKVAEATGEGPSRFPALVNDRYLVTDWPRQVKITDLLTRQSRNVRLGADLVQEAVQVEADVLVFVSRRDAVVFHLLTGRQHRLELPMGARKAAFNRGNSVYVCCTAGVLVEIFSASGGFLDASIRNVTQIPALAASPDMFHAFGDAAFFTSNGAVTVIVQGKATAWNLPSSLATMIGSKLIWYDKERERLFAQDLLSASPSMRTSYLVRRKVLALQRLHDDRLLCLLDSALEPFMRIVIFV